MLQRLNLIDKGQPSQSLTLNPQRLVNLYPTNSFGQESAKTPKALYRTPGTKLFATLPNAGMVRNVLEYRNELYVVSDNILYVVGPSANATRLGTLNTYSGYVSMINNGTQLMLDDGLNGYTYTFSTYVFATIADADFDPSGYVTTQATRAIFIRPDTSEFAISALDDFTSYDVLDFATAESIPQRGVAPFATATDLYILGEKNTEVWSLTQDSLFPYVVRTGVNIPYGLAAKKSIVDIDGQLFFVGRNDQGSKLLIKLSGYTPELAIDEASQYQLSQLETVDDAEAYSFQMNGRIFYAITFPTENKSYLLDIQSKTLIEWSSWYLSGYASSGDPIYVQGRHVGNYYAFFDGKHIVGDYRGGGRLLELDHLTHADYECGVDDSIYFEWSTPVIHKDKYRVYFEALEIDMEVGTSSVSAASGDGTNLPLLRIALSTNGGRSYGYERIVNFGYTGQYNKRVKLLKWGQFLDGNLKIYGNHPSFIAIYGLIAEVDTEDQFMLKTKGQ